MPAPCQNVNDTIAALEQSSSAVATLDVNYGSEAVTTPGVQLANKSVADAPTLKSTNLKPSQRYLLTLLDLDPPFVTFPFLGPILHLLQPDMTVSGSDLTASSMPIWQYLPPTPPPFSGPHRYLFLLYEQPESFDATPFRPAEGQEGAMWPRIRWDHAAFEQKAGLGKVVAANYFNASSS